MEKRPHFSGVGFVKTEMFTQNNNNLAGGLGSLARAGDRRAHDASWLTGEGGGVKQQ